METSDSQNQQIIADKSPGYSSKNLSFDLIAFLMTVVFVVVLDWQTRDVIWGLWICSLTVGYAYIITAIVSGVIHAEGNEKGAAIAMGLFLIPFFSVHFGMFHFVHGVFLNIFFPLIEEGDGFPNLFAMLATTTKLFWPLILTTFISKFSDFPFKGVDLKGNAAFMKPYANVVRMHLLIFVFAGLHFSGMSKMAIYPVLLAYFIPWKEIRTIFKKQN